MPGGIGMEGAISRAFDEGAQALRVTSASVAAAGIGATLASVNDSASTGVLQAANTARRGWYCKNDSTTILYIAFAATATTTAYTVSLEPGAFYEMPQPAYTGVISGIWSADASGAARLTELS